MLLFFFLFELVFFLVFLCLNFLEFLFIDLCIICSFCIFVRSKFNIWCSVFGLMWIFFSFFVRVDIDFFIFLFVIFFVYSRKILLDLWLVDVEEFRLWYVDGIRIWSFFFFISKVRFVFEVFFRWMDNLLSIFFLFLVYVWYFILSLFIFSL